MKHVNTIIVFLLGLLALTACHKDKEFDVKDAVVSNEEITVSGTQARFSWSVDFAGKFQTGVEISQNENMAEARLVEATKEEDRFVAVVDSLLMGTKYYYRFIVWNKFGDFGQPVGDFTTLRSYTILVSADEGGSVIGGGTYIAGDTCTVIATANPNYNFVNWTENGSQVSTETEYSFAVTRDRNLVAHFTLQVFTITATAEPKEGGTVDGSGGYNNGNECTLTATPNEGYTFINWTKDGTEVSTNPVYTFTVTETAIYVANFQMQRYTITVDSYPENGGSVEGGGTYEYGQNCIVRATEANGYHFVNWTENGEQVSSDEEYTFTVTGNRDLVANFISLQCTITATANPTIGGTVTGGGTYNQGQQCTLQANANADYEFSNWTENGQVVQGAGASYTFNVTGNRTLVANFTRQYTITATANPTTGGTVTGGGTYNQGQQCTLHANANADYGFSNWTENGQVVQGAEASYTFNVTSNRTLVANFTRQYTITATANPNVGGTVTGGGTYNQGQQCTLHANANADYEFSNWTENGQVVQGAGVSYTFDVTSNRTLVANFAYNPQYTITTNVNPTGSGTVIGGGQYYFGQSCTLMATPSNSNYIFDHWVRNGTVISGDATISFTVTESATYVAYFITRPTVTTRQVTNITQTTAIGGGNVTNDGGATVTERGICWSTGHNPDMSDSHASSGSGMGSFTVEMTGLIPCTHYYVRAYAVNEVDISYGNEVSFVTTDTGEWLYYDNGTYADAIGTGGSTVYWAAMFPAASIAPYAGTNLTKVAMYEDPSLNTQTITVAIYLGGTTAPQTMVSTQTFNPMGTEGFHEVALNTPVAVDGTQNMWIVFSEYGTYPATGCTDTGDANGRWISVDGTNWEDVASYGLNYTWMIRGYVESEIRGTMELRPIANKPQAPVIGKTINLRTLKKAKQ